MTGGSAADPWHLPLLLAAGNARPRSAASAAGSKPLTTFLGRFAREKDVKVLVEISHSAAPRNAADLDLRILIPASILSELKAGFQIGAVLFMPFLIIDLVVA